MWYINRHWNVKCIQCYIFCCFLESSWLLIFGSGRKQVKLKKKTHSAIEVNDCVHKSSPPLETEKIHFNGFPKKCYSIRNYIKRKHNAVPSRKTATVVNKIISIMKCIIFGINCSLAVYDSNIKLSNKLKSLFSFSYLCKRKISWKVNYYRIV